ncbi:hypothetical protein [Dactylosporangium sp. CA-233914]|uniref:hypothetical protein n=1 Tax=Dactylosporangium sp. CA-233914 TaxID=3239934 RepID=UPI003D938B36
MGVLDVLAENNFGDTRSGGLAGPMGLLIIVLLGIVTVLLIRNMTARIRRLPAEFPDPDAQRRDRDAQHRDPEAGSAADSGANPDQLDKSTPA